MPLYANLYSINKINNIKMCSSYPIFEIKTSHNNLVFTSLINFKNRKNARFKLEDWTPMLSYTNKHHLRHAQFFIHIQLIRTERDAIKQHLIDQLIYPIWTHNLIMKYTRTFRYFFETIERWDYTSDLHWKWQNKLK